MFKKHNSHTIWVGLVFALIYCKSVSSMGFISWYSDADQAVHRISLLNGNYNVFYANHIDTLPQYTLNYSTVDLRLPTKGDHFVSDGKLICVFGGTGSVFSMDTMNRTITRLDRTSHSGYNFDAYQFERRDTIFSFGGYGFWTENNLLTYFSTLRKEWNVYSVGSFPPYNPDFSSGPTYKFAFYDKGADELYVLRQLKFYKYTFADDKWNELGDLIKDNIFTDNGAIFKNRLHRIDDSTVFVMGGLKSLYVIPRRNLVYDVTLPNGLNAGAINIQNPKGFHCGYDSGDELVLVKYSKKVDHGYLFEFVNRWTRKINSQSQLYSKGHFFTLSRFEISLIVFFIIGSLFTISIRTYYLKKRYQYFTDEQWLFIQLLDKGEMYTSSLDEFLNVKTLSWEVQRRKRSEFIKVINDVSMNKLGCELVLRQRTKEDKRHVLYVMNVEAKNKLARLM